MNLLYIHKWHPEYLSNYYNFSNQHNEKYTNRLATFSLVKAWVWVGGCSTPCVSKLLGYTDPKKTVVLSAFTVRNILWVGWGEEVLLEREELEGVVPGGGLCTKCTAFPSRSWIKTIGYYHVPQENPRNSK